MKSLRHFKNKRKCLAIAIEIGSESHQIICNEIFAFPYDNFSSHFTSHFDLKHMLKLEFVFSSSVERNFFVLSLTDFKVRKIR